MKTVEYQFRVEIYLSLTLAEVKWLILLAEHHYDAHCESFADDFRQVNGQTIPRGRLRTLEFWMELQKETETNARFTWDEMDTLCKITEIESMMQPSPENLKLHIPLTQAFAGMRSESERVNSTPVTDKKEATE